MMETESSENLLSKIEELEIRLAEAEQLIEAIKAGEVDAFALNKNNQPEIFTLQSGDYAYRVLVENFGEGALNLSEEGLIVYTNSYFHELLNLPYEKTIGNSIFQFIHPDSQEIFALLFKKGFTGSSKGEINLVSGQKIIPVYVSLTSLSPTLPTVGIIVTDLSESKRKDKILEQKNAELSVVNEELRHNRNFIDNVLQSTNHGVLSYAAIRENNEVVDLEIRYANEKALEQLSFQPEQVIGGRYLTIFPNAKEVGAWQRVLRVLKSGVSESHEIISPFNNERCFLVHYVKLDDGVTCTFVEITEQKLQAKVLEEKNIELAKSNTELASFSYIASHDLQEPLRKIQSFSSRILEKEDPNLSENGKMMFARMQLAANRMQTLIDDLLSYSRTNTADRKFEIVNLEKLAEEIRQEMKEELKEKNAVLNVSAPCDVFVMPFQFRQLLHNLIGNSLKFSIPGQIPVITIKAKIARGSELRNSKLSPDKNYCHISIADNGIGFDQQYSDRIFELFQRLHGKHEYSGTGIGLSIVKRIVENHNGVIAAHGESGKGATFDIYIPDVK